MGCLYNVVHTERIEDRTFCATKDSPAVHVRHPMRLIENESKAQSEVRTSFARIFAHI